VTLTDQPSQRTAGSRDPAHLPTIVDGRRTPETRRGLGSLGSHTAAFGLANLVLTTAVNVALYLLASRVLTRRQIPTRQLVGGSIAGGVAWQALLAAGGYLVGHNLKHATSEVYGARARRLWPRSLLQPPLTQPDQRGLVDLAKKEERRPEQSVEVTFTPPNPNSASPTGPRTPGTSSEPPSIARWELVGGLEPPTCCLQDRSGSSTACWCVLSLYSSRRVRRPASTLLRG
jgi:hypothetical protein